MRLGIGVLVAFVMALGAGPAVAQARQVYVLEMDVADLRAEVMRIARDEAEISLGGLSTSQYAQSRVQANGDLLTITMSNLKGDNGLVIEALREALPGFDVVLRIDGKVEARLTDDGLARRLLPAMKASEAIIERRLDLAGISRPQVELRDGMRLEVSLSTRVAEDVANLLTARGAVSFHRVATDRDPASFEPGVAKGGFVALPNEAMGGELQVIQLLPIIAVGEIASAEAGFDDYNRPNISFRLASSGRIKFAQATSDMIGVPFAIVADGVILSAPVVNSPITGGEGQITGSFTMEEAELLAVSISGGVLPARLVIAEQRLAEAR